MTAPLIRTFSHHYRSRYGEPVGKIPIDTGHPCPNREKGGCIFCRPASFTPGYLDNKQSCPDQIARGKVHILKNRFRKYFAYFQQETCTALPPKQLLPEFEFILNDPSCVGLILSTRPDYVQKALLTPLAELIQTTEKECLFELGLQTIHDESLRLLNRNHSYTQFTDAVSLIQSYRLFDVGVHLIFGIPGESDEMMLETVSTVCGQGIEALKLHHLQVIESTELEKLYNNGEVELFSLERYIAFLLRALPLIPANVVIHRLWATSHPDILIAPKWNVLATHLSRKLQETMSENGIFQGQLYTGITS